MAMREYTDKRGTRWRVWSTMLAPEAPLARYYPEGWLTFDCGSDTLRRLSPIPPGWESVGDDRLDLMCRAAEEVPRHTGEMLKLERPSDLPPPADSGAPPDANGSAGGGDRRPNM